MRSLENGSRRAHRSASGSLGPCLAAILLLVPLAPVAAQDAVPVLTLQQSIDAALAHGDDYQLLQRNLDVVRAQTALAQSKNSLTLAVSGGYGQDWLMGTSGLQSGLKGVGPLASPVNAQAGVTLAGPLTSVTLSSAPYNPSNPPTTPDAQSTVAVSASQTLWNGYGGGPTQAAVDQSLLTLQGKELATEAGRLTLIYQIKQAYYTMLAAQLALALDKEILDKQNALGKQVQTLYDMKQASLVDLKTAQINAKSAQIAVDTADHNLRFARVALATLMGMPPDSAFSVAPADDPALPVASVDDAVQQGLSRRVEIKQQDLNIRSGTIAIALARGQGTPTVNLTGNVNVLVNWGTSATSAQSVGVGVKVSAPILDAGAVQNQVNALVKQNDAYAIQETQLRKSITNAIQSAWESVQLAREQRDLAQMQADMNALQYQITKAQFDNGTAANQDVLTASVNDANAQTTLQSARSAVQLAELQLLSVIGY